MAIMHFDQYNASLKHNAIPSVKFTEGIEEGIDTIKKSQIKDLALYGSYSRKMLKNMGNKTRISSEQSTFFLNKKNLL